MEIFTKLLALSLILSGSASVSAKEGIDARVDMFRIGKNMYRLEQSDGAVCSTRNEKTGQSVNLDMQGPCQLLRSNGRVQSYTYNKIGTVFYIAGPPSEIAAFPGHNEIKAEDKCSTIGQPIFMKSNGHLVTGKVYKNNIFCPEIGVDEEDFYGAAYHLY